MNPSFHKLIYRDKLYIHPHVSLLSDFAQTKVRKWVFLLNHEMSTHRYKTIT